MKVLLYFIGLTLVVILEKAFLPTLFGAASPFVWVLFSLYIYKERPLKEAITINGLLAFLLGAISGNVFLYAFLALIVYGGFVFLSSIFGRFNNWTLLLAMLVFSFCFGILFFFTGLPKEVITAGVTLIFILVSKVFLTLVTSILLLPAAAKYFDLLSAYEFRIKLPVR